MFNTSGKKMHIQRTQTWRKREKKPAISSNTNESTRIRIWVDLEKLLKTRVYFGKIPVKSGVKRRSSPTRRPPGIDPNVLPALAKHSFYRNTFSFLGLLP
uniref:Uncharacterized protein n=1 Tax=Micrurus paraensis TaxID=1970185 RepID=A0A2D4JXT8_9SAUR